MFIKHCSLRMPPKICLPEEFRNRLFYPDYWARDPSLWGDYPLVRRDTHTRLCPAIWTVLLNLPKGGFRHQKALALCSSLKEKLKSVSLQNAAEDYSLESNNVQEDALSNPFLSSSESSKREIEELEDSDSDIENEVLLPQPDLTTIQLNIEKEWILPSGKNVARVFARSHIFELDEDALVCAGICQIEGRSTWDELPTIAEVREALTKPFCTNYDVTKHYNLEYVHMLIDPNSVVTTFAIKYSVFRVFQQSSP
ncbi:hypothetical protein BC936DRAFT_146910 [Jimgerdemannia flammicorona]|uniref:Uncharacterized protein n=1 Tax=Jimgerdemannia flammicorona TaxID=994334 RepID=A0A433D6H7_9FUNG|nr:hypothetical protein BC936DRAFT_146910 [Jimgerdemannia flammicorona]